MNYYHKHVIACVLFAVYSEGDPLPIIVADRFLYRPTASGLRQYYNWNMSYFA